MFEHFAWWPFLIAITTLTLVPGVDTLMVMRNAMRGGIKDGLLTNLGICLGLFVHAIVSAVGLSVILLSSAHLFMLLKFAGAGYLIWLGMQTLRAAFDSAPTHPTNAQMRSKPIISVSPWTSLREGWLSNVLNPKTIVFYMAFLPQFIDPHYNAMPQAMMMAGVHFIIGLTWQGAIVLLVSKTRLWLNDARITKVLTGVTGSLLIVFGLTLVSHR